MRPQQAGDPKSLLMQVLPDYPLVSSAPTGFASDLQREFERSKRYKAIDRNGNVWLCTNPHVHEYGEYANGTRYLIDHDRFFMGHISELLKGERPARKTPAKEISF